MDGIIMAAQMILALSIIVGIHEFGHLLAAKFFGMRVEKYFIGFPPKIFSFNYKGTEYGLGSIPLGGFVKITGIIDESMDTTHLKKEPEECLWDTAIEERDFDENGIKDLFYYDTDCNDVADTYGYDENEDGEIDLYLLDTNESGNPDVRLDFVITDR